MTKPEELSCANLKEIHAQSRNSGLTKHGLGTRSASGTSGGRGACTDSRRGRRATTGASGRRGPRRRPGRPCPKRCPPSRAPRHDSVPDDLVVDRRGRPPKHGRNRAAAVAPVKPVLDRAPVEPVQPPAPLPPGHAGIPSLGRAGCQPLTQGCTFLQHSSGRVRLSAVKEGDVRMSLQLNRTNFDNQGAKDPDRYLFVNGHSNMRRDLFKVYLDHMKEAFIRRVRRSAPKFHVHFHAWGRKEAQMRMRTKRG